MSKTDREYDWLNDPFDEGKQADELKRAQASQRTGCIVVVLVAVVIIVALTILGCTALTSLAV